jgi:putative DNA primase/helicase
MIIPAQRLPRMIGFYIELEKKIMNKVNVSDIEHEQSEQCEQLCISESSNSSQLNTDSANTENNCPEVIVNPIDTSPEILLDLGIMRPCFQSHEACFQIDGRKYPAGLYWHGISSRGNGNKEIDEFICSPITVVAITCNLDGADFGRILQFCDTNNNWHKWAMPMRLLRGSGDDLLAELLDQGLIFDSKKRSYLIRYLMNSKTKNHVLSASKIGWHKKTFVLPNRVIGDGDIIFQSGVVTENDFKESGSLESWNHDIGRLCVGNIPLIVSVATALAGPLLMILNRQQGGGIHWVGDSSSGKSTCIEVAASVWGSPDFIRSWSATANGIEGVVAMRNDTCIILDEIDEALPHDISRITYMLVNGQGKQRAGRTGNAKQIKRWRTMALSTGERTLSSIMNEVQKQPNSGQLVRLLNVNAEFEYGVFSNLHEFDSGRSLSDHLKSARLKNYGTLGLAFIERLIRDNQDFSYRYNDVVEVLSKHATNNLENRSASTMAVIALAGELAIEYGLVPWDPTTAIRACLDVFTRWKIDTTSGLTEEDRILEYIRTFIDKNGDTRFSMLGSFLLDNNMRDRAGWFKDSGDVRTYMFFGYALDEAAKKYERARIVKALKKANWLCDHDTGRNTKKTRVPGGTKDLYYIKVPENTDETET